MQHTCAPEPHQLGPYPNSLNQYKVETKSMVNKIMETLAYSLSAILGKSQHTISNNPIHKLLFTSHPLKSNNKAKTHNTQKQLQLKLPNTNSENLMDLKPTRNNTSKKTPDGKTTSSLTKYFKSLNLNQKMSVSQKHSSKQEALSKDTILQAKSMSASAILDSSSSKSTSFINKSCPQHRKESKMTKQAVCSKEKPKKKCPKEEKTVKKSTKMMDVKDLRSSYDGNIDVKKLSKMVRNDDVDDKSRRVSVGRRRSFCDSNVELAGIFASNGVKVVAVDMPPFMQIHAVDCARKTYDSLEKFTSKSLALTLKKEFDGVYGPAWHCIVGKSFGSFVTHSVGGFMYFSMDQKLYILLFKTTVLKAE